MGRIHLLQVQYGDAFIIECSRGEKKGVVVVDGGPRSSSNTFIEAVNHVAPIDLMVLTHYDKDHIEGILELIAEYEDRKEPLPVKEIWANCAQFIPVTDTTRTSPSQGVTLAKKLQDYADGGVLKWKNNVFEGYKPEFDFVDITVVSPTEQVMGMAIKRQQEEDGAPTKATDRTNEDLGKSLEELAVRPIKEPNLKSDSQLANAASIAFVLQCDNLSVLMLGDCYPHNVENYLRGKGISEDNPLKVDYVKVSHHGSRNNTSNGLLDIIKCDNYIISTNGGDGNACHPDRETLAHILCHQKRMLDEKVHIYMNYDINDVEEVGAPFLNKGEEEKYNFEIHSNTTII